MAIKNLTSFGGLVSPRSNHSTEIALVKVLYDIYSNTNSGKISVLVFLDLSDAFGMVNHNILLDLLKNWVGLFGPARPWFESYLKDRHYFVTNLNIQK